MIKEIARKIYRNEITKEDYRASIRKEVLRYKIGKSCKCTSPHWVRLKEAPKEGTGKGEAFCIGCTARWKTRAKFLNEVKDMDEISDIRFHEYLNSICRTCEGHGKVKRHGSKKNKRTMSCSKCSGSGEKSEKFEWPAEFGPREKKEFRLALRRAKKKGIKQGTPEFNRILRNRGFVPKKENEDEQAT